MAKSKYKVAVMDELPSDEQLAMEKMEKASFEKMNAQTTDATTAEQETAPVAEETATPTKPAKVAGFRSKRYKTNKSSIDRSKTYSVSDALEMLRSQTQAKFDETVEVHFVTKEVLGTVEVAYPHSTGKTVRVSVFSSDLLEKLDKGVIEFDVLVASPADMKSLTKYARLLGPKGLMPNPKNGTLVADPAKRAKDLESGKTSVRSEKKAPLMHTTIGKVSLGTSALAANFQALLDACGQGKVLKGVICTTMSPGIRVSIA